jgi:phosphoribosyl-AMP cyclohydrolase
VVNDESLLNHLVGFDQKRAYHLNDKHIIASYLDKFNMIQLDFEKTGGLIPAIAQDDTSGEILMLAYMNQEAFDATLSTGTATYYSRSRQKLWIKGETSGNVQRVNEIRIDCDNDTILLKVEQIGGAACHTGHRTCFHKKIENGSARIIGEPLFDPEEVYSK